VIVQLSEMLAANEFNSPQRTRGRSISRANSPEERSSRRTVFHRDSHDMRCFVDAETYKLLLLHSGARSPVYGN
jgi:hypothetical protein